MKFVKGLRDTWELHGGELHLAHVELERNVTLKLARRPTSIHEHI